MRALAVITALALVFVAAAPANAAPRASGQATTAKAMTAAKKKAKRKRSCVKRKAAKRKKPARKTSAAVAAKRKRPHHRKVRYCKKAKPKKKKAPATKPAPPTPTTPTTPIPTTPAPPSEPLGHAVSAATSEFKITLSRPKVAAGQVTVEFRNKGEDPHDLVVSPEANHDPFGVFDELLPAGVATKSLNFAPGRYRLWCSLEGHEALGMTTTLTVQ